MLANQDGLLCVRHFFSRQGYNRVHWHLRGGAIFIDSLEQWRYKCLCGTIELQEAAENSGARNIYLRTLPLQTGLSVRWLRDKLMSIPEYIPVPFFASILWTMEMLSLSSSLNCKANMAMTILNATISSKPSPIGWGCRIHGLRLSFRGRYLQWVSWMNIKLSDGEAPVMIWWM